MNGDLPTGTVTFLFTDVEGSTRLLEELGAERYAVELGRHRDIVRGALADHSGVEVDTQGDAFFCAFSTAVDAVAAASAMQELLARGRLRVRMGVHTGEALAVDGHYVGMDVHRAARIGACGHGGQVVVSPATVALLPTGAFPLTELGAHRLKDLAAPLTLYQLGSARFPRLKALFATNLPVPATPFIGREHELHELIKQASEPGIRLVTLTGPGGTGKTRLSLQLAAEISEAYPDGTWWVSLAPLRDASSIASALANVLEVDEEPGRSLGDSIVAALAGKRALVLLDNCEHLVDAAARLASAVASACPDVLLLATSREALAIGGEHVYPVEPLVDDDAVDLFFTRARSAGAALGEAEREVVVELCGRLDNLPLAVELAAARAAALPPAALLERLSTGLDVLKGPRDVEERQRTLRATIAWSCGLLEEPEQRLFRRLGVFVGGASLSAVEDVCEADLEDLLSLVAKSLVRQLSVDGSEPRYWMLETIREFASDELDASGERGMLREHHMQLFAGRAREFYRAADTNAADAREWLARMELDLSNVRAAFESAAADGRSDDAIALAMALWISHQARGRYSEAADVMRQALEFDPGPLERSMLQEGLGRVLRIQGHPAEALEAYEASERAVESIAERGSEWWKRWVELEMSKASLFYFENMQEELGSLVRELEPLVNEHGTEIQKVELLHLRTQHAYRLERYAPSAETEQLAREAHRRAVEVGDVGGADFILGFCLLWRGKLEEAEEHLARGQESARSWGLALPEIRCLVYGSIARRRRNDVEGARSWLRELEQQDELHGYQGLTAANAGWVALRDGDLDLARARGREALADWYAGAVPGSPFEWTARFPLLAVALVRGNVEEALEHGRALLDESLQPLPDALRLPLAEAVDSGSVEELARVLDSARQLGFA